MAEENYDDENIAEPQPFPPEMVNTPQSKTVAMKVREYLWSMEPVNYGDVSAQMDRELVSRFVGFEMPGLPPERFRRVRILADLYNLVENLEYIELLLNKSESTPSEVVRSVYCAIILREIGNENQKKIAAQYYEYLVRHPKAETKLDTLVEALAALGNDVGPNSLISRMEREARSLAAKEPVEPEAGPEARYIAGLLDNEFFIINGSNKARERFSRIASIDERLTELIRAYLLLTDDEGGEYFALWNHQQIRRIAESEGNEKVVEAFRSVLSSLGRLDAEDELFCRIRAYNAIEFFHGEPTESEAELLERSRDRQVDPLQVIPVEPYVERIEEPEATDDETETEG